MVLINLQACITDFYNFALYIGHDVQIHGVNMEVHIRYNLLVFVGVPFF